MFIDKYISNQLVHTGNIVTLLLGFYLSSYNSYLLFQGLNEITTIATSFALFILIWNTRTYLKNNDLRLTGIAYSYITQTDLRHTVAYKGMNILPDEE